MTSKPALTEDPVLCQCSGTTQSYIAALVKQGLDVATISQRSGALTGCGGCEWDIVTLVNALSAQHKNQP